MSVQELSNGADESGPFEGPEKLLEIWWTDRAENVPEGQGLRAVSRSDWEVMLDLVHCKILSVISGNNVDAYMLSESSMFIWPHKMILKTCGTTTLLLGLETILRLASQVGFTKSAWRIFYSRKSFMFPERQKGPHRDWKEEMSLLDRYFKDGKGYTVGPMNGDHWMLYMNQKDDVGPALPQNPPTPGSRRRPPPDQTMEILMTELDSEACQKFFHTTENASLNAHVAGRQLSAAMGVDQLFPSQQADGSASPSSTKLDAYLFDPCGYSLNLIAQEDRYATIHVTPEADCSYASFETNASFGRADASDARLGVQDMVAKVLDIFRPKRFSLTLFVSRDEDEPETSGEQGIALLHKGKFPMGYRRTDKILYEFEDYDLLYVLLLLYRFSQSDLGLGDAESRTIPQVQHIRSFQLTKGWWSSSTRDYT